jgi:hypothetical protein
VTRILAVYIALVIVAAALSLAGVYLLSGAGLTLIVAGLEALAASEVVRRGMTGVADVE